MAHYIELSPIDLVLATGLIATAGMVSIVLRLGITGNLFIASSRCVLQLGVIGLVLRHIFQIRSPLFVLSWLVFMLFMAAMEATRRSRRRYPGIFQDSVLTMLATALISGGLVTQMIIRVEPWYDPQYVIPIFGMIFGNSLNGISLAMDRLLDYTRTRAQEIELMLAFGATQEEALRDGAREAVRSGMIPIINSMTVAGIVSLPGMMTGQIIAGASPIQAVAYQVVIMFMIAASNALGSMTMTTLAGKRLVTLQGLREM